MRLIARTATSSNVPAILAIEQQSPTAAHWSSSHYHSALADPTRLVLVAEHGSQLVGFLVASMATLEWELENIAVTPLERRRGIASKLMNRLIARAQKDGASEIRQEIRVSNLAAQRLGQATGFQQQGRRNGYYREPAEDALLFKYLVKPP